MNDSMSASPQGIPHERLIISGGTVGPLKPCTLEIRPLTVLLGQQGTGKSLVAQLLYLFRHLPTLIPYCEASLAPGHERSDTNLLEAALNGMRSRDGQFSAFLEMKQQVDMAWTSDAPSGETEEQRIHLSKETFPRSRRLRLSLAVNEALGKRLTRIRGGETPHWRRALFVPAERLLYSELSSAAAFQVLRPPLTLSLFIDEMEAAGKTYESWEGGGPDTAGGSFVHELAREALGGEAVRRQDAWKWSVAGTRRLLSIDMASSGQKANWPLVLLAEVLFSWREEGRIGATTTLYVEEPEMHLHPAAQRAMVEILAYLVNQGFRVVLTTHSLTVVYALNNLALATALPMQVKEGVPRSELRLEPDKIAALLCERDGTVRELVDRRTGFISESELGQVSEELSAEMNTIGSLTAP